MKHCPSGHYECNHGIDTRQAEIDRLRAELDQVRRTGRIQSDVFGRMVRAERLLAAVIALCDDPIDAPVGLYDHVDVLRVVDVRAAATGSEK